MRASALDLTFRTVRKRKRERLRPCLNAGQSRFFAPVCGENKGRREENGKNHSIPFPYYGMRLRRIADLCTVIIKK